jgi:spermidine synthase
VPGPSVSISTAELRMNKKPSPSTSLFLFFFVSGFCTLLYQIVWVRLAFASFGIITPVLSVVLSVFMLGLALGSWAAGRWVTVVTQRWEISAIYLYAVAEGLIGLSAFAVPRSFILGERALLGFGESESLGYLTFSGIWIAMSIFPWCFLMGTTFPLMLAFIEARGTGNPKIFSFLYQANVLGALVGIFFTACVFVELFGFRTTLLVGGMANFFVGVAAWVLGLKSTQTWTLQRPPEFATEQNKRELALNYFLLFTTGFVSMAMEVVWTRAFTPVMGTQVYAFAALLFIYLLATWKGTSDYRRQVHSSLIKPTPQLVGLLTVFTLLPVVINDPRLNPAGLGPHLSVFLVLVSIVPFCACLGYLTPKLIDECSHGDPAAAGNAYALNVVGCILGPLFACYVLLPWIGARDSMLILGLPILCLHFSAAKGSSPRLRWGAGLSSGLLMVAAWFGTVSYEDPQFDRDRVEVRRDHTATVISFGEGFSKKLLVNGMGITDLSSVPKFMAHLPMAFHQGRPETALVICFGMGTTYRSLLSWGADTTAIELVPSVKEAFGYYFDDAAEVLRDPKGRVVIDDGRRFLRRTQERFDVITVDPPPPAEAAGSSLLYSTDFYRLIQQRLKPNGVLQQWFAVGERKILQAVARSLQTSFPHVRVLPSTQGWGYHFLASLSPIEGTAPAGLASRFPEGARQDAVEWIKDKDLGGELSRLLANEIPLSQLLNDDPKVVIYDDLPFNEYFMIRRVLDRL